MPKKSTKHTVSPAVILQRVVSRHPAVIAWDEWKKQNPTTLTLNGLVSAQYLENRLSRAFQDGWNAAENHNPKR